MNRIHLNSAQPDTVTRHAYPLEPSLLSTSPRRGFCYSLFAPLHYEPNYAYPLIVWLHGPGDDERQLQRVMPLVSMRNYVSISPRGSRQVEGSRGFQWLDADGDASDAEQKVFECLELAGERFCVARQRIFLAGHRSGGTVALRVGLRNPRRFAGVLSLGGAFPTGHRPLIFLDEARALPLFIAQGRRSTRYTVERSCEELRLFHSAGMHVTLRQYPCGDELIPVMLHDMNVWIMERVTGVESLQSH